jgi:hypothetical protein
MMAVVLVHRLVSTPMVWLNFAENQFHFVGGYLIKLESSTFFQIFLQKLISRFHVVVSIVQSRDEGSPDKTWDDENDNNEVMSQPISTTKP